MEKQCLGGCGREVRRWRLCEVCGNLLAGACLGKARFRNPAECHRRQRTFRDVRTAVYRCPVCDRWHLGRPPGAEVVVRQDRLVRRLRAAGSGWLLGHLADEWADLGYVDRVAFKAAWKVGAW